MNQSIELHFHIADFVQASVSGDYYVNPEFEAESITLFHRLKLIYLKESVAFSLLLLLTTTYRYSEYEILDMLFISHSYLKKLIQTINQQLAKFSIQITLSDKQLFLTGNELSVRLFSFLLLSDSYQNLEWPFQHISKKQIKQSLTDDVLRESAKKSETKKTLFYFFIAIITLRTQNNCHLPPLSEETEHLFEMIYKSKNVARIFNHLSLGEMKPTIKKNEILYFNFLSSLFIPDIIEPNKKIELGYLFIQNNSFPTNFSKVLLKRLKYTFKGNYTGDIQATFTYFFTLLCLFLQLVNIRAPYFLNLQFPPLSYNLNSRTKTIVQIQNLYSDLITQKKFVHYYETFSLVSTKHYFCSLIYALVQMTRTPNLQIYLQLTKNFTDIPYVTQQLSILFNPEIVTITTDIRTANLVISDTLEPSSNDQPVFFIDSLRDYAQWQSLVEMIHQLLVKQLFDK